MTDISTNHENSIITTVFAAFNKQRLKSPSEHLIAAPPPLIMLFRFLLFVIKAQRLPTGRCYYMVNGGVGGSRVAV